MEKEEQGLSLQRFLGPFSGACWSQPALACSSWLCSSLLNSAVSDMLVAWNWPWWRYLHLGSLQMLPIGIFFFLVRAASLAYHCYLSFLTFTQRISASVQENFTTTLTYCEHKMTTQNELERDKFFICAIIKDSLEAMLCVSYNPHKQPFTSPPSKQQYMAQVYFLSKCSIKVIYDPLFPLLTRLLDLLSPVETQGPLLPSTSVYLQLYWGF